MNKSAIFLIALALLLGGMLGYSVAYSTIFRHFKEQARVSAIDDQPGANASPKVDFASSEQPFPKIIRQATGNAVLPLDSASQPIIDAIEQAANTTMARLNEPSSPIRGLARINEASRYFEDSLQELLDANPALSCDVPLTKEGKSQRSGYPDLKIVHRPTGRTYYFDPKLYEATSRDSSLRTFYYTPRKKTSKILDSAHHLLIGFAHDGNDGAWQFQSWSLVDLSQIALTLKSEYNASNQDLYQEEAIILER
jgi:hypothetical protein